jgi:pimeloyl-ACP methyl ester carboxylesterase
VRERETRRRVDEQLADGIERMDIEQFADRWARTPVLADQPQRVVAAARVDRLRNTPAGLAAALRALGTGALPSLWDRLGELTMPVMMIVGGRDERFQAVAVRMAGRVPHAEVAIVAGAGHAVHLEAPEEVARLITL